MSDDEPTSTRRSLRWTGQIDRRRRLPLQELEKTVQRTLSRLLVSASYRLWGHGASRLSCPVVAEDRWHLPC